MATDREALLHVHRRKFDEMPHACCFGSPRYCFVSRWDLRTGIDKKEFVHSLKSCLEGHWVREIADEDFDAIAEARPRFSASRTKTRGQSPRWSKCSTTLDPTSPVAPVMRYVMQSPRNEHQVHTYEDFSYSLTEVPHRAGGMRDFALCLHGAFLAISSGAPELKKRGDLDKVVFVVTHMVEALSHGAVLRRPPGLSLADVKAEVLRAVLAYLHA